MTTTMTTVHEKNNNEQPKLFMKLSVKPKVFSLSFCSYTETEEKKKNIVTK